MHNPLQPTKLGEHTLGPPNIFPNDDPMDVDPPSPSDIDDLPSDDSFGSDFSSAAEDVEDDFLSNDKGQENIGPAPLIPSKPTLAPSSSSQRGIIQGTFFPSWIGQAKKPTANRPRDICHSRPCYDDGRTFYPTCGNSCAAKMKANENPPPPVRGGNQRPVGGPPQHGPQITSSWSDNFKFANAVKKNIPRSNVIKMCDVCHVRPRCQKQGKIYPTCGLSCAAKMHPPGTIEMCDYCKQRPKIIINGKVYPQCGKTCRDKAKSAATADDAAACTTCIICWKASKHSPNSDFCSKGCESVAQCKAPFLIELPRGHVSFKKVADTFISAWNTPKRPCPVVKKVYMVVVKSSVHATYDNYRTRVGSNGLFAKKGNERKRWLGTTRECGFGNSGDLEPCSSNKCLLCCVVRSKVDRQFFPDGITTTSSLPRAVETSENSKRKLSSKVVMLTNVLLGREVEMSRDELIQPLPPRGSDSVRVVSFRGFGGKVDQGEIVVYDGDAVKPLYLIVYG